MEKYQHRKKKIAAVTACSNVTGIETPYHKIAKVIHQYGGVCFVDFACSAPYVNINMKPKDKEERLDAIYFSPHKFLGGPGTNGVLIFDKNLYNNTIPDHPGGGTVKWVDPWGGRSYLDDIEKREDGGTPGFLQVIKTALTVKLKEEMGVSKILAREKEQLELVFNKLRNKPHLHILQGDIRERLGVFSFYTKAVHYNLFTKLLSDRFGIQARGGCSCAGPYGHYLLGIGKEKSRKLRKEIEAGNLQHKPGWVRISIHPTMTNSEITFIADAILSIMENHEDWKKDYSYDKRKNQFFHRNTNDKGELTSWFE
ncbi:MAG: aminotransferase class V-fold PLP-dependent enzyme [Bacillus sp. (in: Bacteria)]|nr:aminotransferase class V-fold PLP-dependent enzyme [Bacillus sp. (in: firmicutes)]